MSYLAPSENVIDAVALLLLDIGMNGEFSYNKKNSSGPLTDKQKNMKREVKVILTKWFSEGSTKQSMRLIFDAILSMNQFVQSKNEIIELKAIIEAQNNKSLCTKEYMETLYKDEIRAELKAQLDQDREEAIESSRRVNRRLIKTIEKLEEQIAGHKDKRSNEEYEMLRQQNIEMNEIILDLRKKTKLNRKALEIQKILAAAATE